MKISAYLRTDKADSRGLYKIVIRISDGKHREYQTTKFAVQKHQFKDGRVIKHPEEAHMNLTLLGEIENYKRILSEHQIDSNNHRLTFENYCCAFIDENTNERRESTIKYYHGEISKFKDFYKGDILLKRIDEDIITQYKQWMFDKKNKHNTVWKSLKFLKTILAAAERKGLIASNPFKRMKPFKYDQPKRDYLTSEEVMAIKNLDIEKSHQLYSTKYWFLIQCYTGLRAGDLVQLNLAEIKQKRKIHIKMNKTRDDLSVPVNGEEVIEFIEKAGPFNITLQEYNRRLKSISVIAGIKSITSHIGRHAFAMRVLETGSSKEVLQKLLGHKNFKTTEIYGKISDARVEREFKNFDFK